MRDGVIVIGSMNYDIILKVSRLPDRGETMAAEETVFAAGGKGANQAVQTARLGVRTHMGGCVGLDSMGDYLLKAAEEAGIDVSCVRRVEEPTGMAAVHAFQDGSVCATIVRGANYAVTKEDVDRMRPLLLESGLAVLQMEIPPEVTEYAIEAAGECGCRVLLNAAPAAAMDEEHLRRCGIVAVNEVEASFYCGKEIDSVERAAGEIVKLSRRYGNDWIFTLGSRGAVICEAGEVTYVAPHRVCAVETTGAGDSYIGGVSYGLIQGMSLAEAGEFAAGCSALTICRPGAQPSMPTLKEVTEFRKSLSY